MNISNFTNFIKEANYPPPPPQKWLWIVLSILYIVYLLHFTEENK